MIKYFEAFAGIGAFRSAFEKVGGFECVGWCEIDRFAQKAYRTLYDTKGEIFYEDITKIDYGNMPDFDLLVGGPCCQSFSVAGRRLAFEDDRGNLFFNYIQILEAKRPRYFIAENVPNLLGISQGECFRIILEKISELGYSMCWRVLNSAGFGIPQSRRRLFLIGYLDPRCAGKILPVFGTGGKALVQVLGGPQGSRIYDADGVACTQTAGAGGMGGKTGLYLVGFNRKDGIVGKRDTAIPLNASDFRGINRNQTQNAVLVDLCSGHPKQTDAARCLTARYGQTTLSNRKGERSGVLLIKEATKKGYKEAQPGDTVDLGYAGSNTRRGRVGCDIAHTLETSCIQGIVENGGRIRRLMPRECLRLQGFEEWQIDRILAIQSDAQAYKQAGNSVTVNVIEAIAKRIQAVDEELKTGAAA